MVKADRVVVEREGLVGGKVDHLFELPGMVEQRWEPWPV
jgi:hypothetical protein